MEEFELALFRSWRFQGLHDMPSTGFRIISLAALGCLSRRISALGCFQQILKPKDETLTEFRPGFRHYTAKQVMAGDPISVRQDWVQLLSAAR